MSESPKSGEGKARARQAGPSSTYLDLGKGLFLQ